MSMKITVVCPHCGGEQQESSATISTVCHRCKGYFSLEYKSAGRRLKKQRPSRLIRCSQCDAEQKVYEDALSAVCTVCGAHLDIGNYTLEGTVRHRLSTSGDITFGSSVRYVGPEVRAQRVTVSGQIKARIRATQEIVFAKVSEVRGALVAPLIRVLRGADADADRIVADRVEAEGGLRTKLLFARDHVHVLKDGKVAAGTIATPEIVVEAGGAISGRLDTTALPMVESEIEE